MFKKHIYDNPHLKVVFETVHPVLFSLLQDGAFEKTWKPWKPRYFALREDGSVIYRKNKQSPIKARLDLTNTKISKVVLEDATSNPLLKVEYGINVSCFRDGVPTSFRCILGERDWNAFHEAVQKHVSGSYIDDSLTNIRASSSHAVSNGSTQSTMRTAITHAMDKYDKTNNKINIMRRRGALKWLPVHRANDLVLGSWWFVAGSIMMVITSAIVLANDYNPVIGEDDSTLSTRDYRGSWALMIISGIFFTLGSLAFVRAVHESPPMKPLFTWRHVASDELLGSWLFLFACLPFFPYALIYVSEADPPHKPLYIGALVAVSIILLGCLLFVFSCYPSNTNEKPKSTMLPCLQSCLCLCFSKEFLSKHLANDWLAGCWLILWGSVAACIAALVLTFYAVVDNQRIQIFIFSTTFIENVVFLVGSAYFVAGSYPEPTTDAESESTAAFLDDPLLDEPRRNSNQIALI